MTPENENAIPINEFISSVAQRSGQPNELVKDYIRVLFDTISSDLKISEKTLVYQFGVFKRKWTAQRDGIDPNTKEKITIKGHYRATFSPAKALDEKVNTPIEAESTTLYTPPPTQDIESATKTEPTSKINLEEPSIKEIEGEGFILPNTEELSKEKQAENTEDPLPNLFKEDQPVTKDFNPLDISLENEDYFISETKAKDFDTEIESLVNKRNRNIKTPWGNILKIIISLILILLILFGIKSCVSNIKANPQLPAVAKESIKTEIIEPTKTVETTKSIKKDVSVHYSTPSKREIVRKLNEISPINSSKLSRKALAKYQRELKDKQNRKIIKKHLVKRGENIYDLTIKYWGNQNLWPDMYLMNVHKIANPEKLKYGFNIDIYKPWGEKTSNLGKKQRDDLVQIYLITYKVYKALAMNDIENRTNWYRRREGRKQKRAAVWILYSAAGYDNDLIKKYHKAIDEEDLETLKDYLKRFGYR